LSKNNITVGLNDIFKKCETLQGGGYLISIKIYNTNLIMQVEYGTKLGEVYQRVAQWLDLGPDI
jgi:hypothetical protein